ncbi:hypothetical protein AVEN_230988-1 [Araneus ventricosus]|uniref:Helitron helicase-like domain-containing protein n=1 Tax=Araneus ventricosus TaxID=182803 RepID=A0A4Y2A2T0_ARAVE|nr:hypothetical protein AVEN_230988-1 [Araneus ventricosus]
MYAKFESERLLYIRLNQRTQRVEQFVHLRDAGMNEGDLANIGQLIILPSSFTGGPRYMHERTQDAMTYMKNYGRPDVFINFTHNSNWTEIQQKLFVGQKPQDRHDLLQEFFIKSKNTHGSYRKGKYFWRS